MPYPNVNWRWLWDVAEPRILKERLVVSGDGTSWDMESSSGIWRDPVTQSVFLLPMVFTPEWVTQFTGDYKRLGKGDFTFGDADKWVETHRVADGDTYINTKGPLDDTAISIQTFEANQPFYISTYVPDLPGSSKQIALECGWSQDATPGDTEGDMALRFWQDGTITLYKTNPFDDGSGTPALIREPIWSSDLKSFTLDAGKQTATPTKKAGKTIEYMLIPFQGTSILIYTSEGSGVVVPVAGGSDVIRPDTGAGQSLDIIVPVITPRAHFFFRVPPPAKACVQVAPLRFVPEGKLFTPEVTLRYPLDGTEGLAWNYYPSVDWAGPQTSLNATSGPGYQLGVVDAVTGVLSQPDVPPEGLPVITTKVRLEWLLRASESHDACPVIYAADVIFPPVPTATLNESETPSCYADPEYTGMIVEEIQINAGETDVKASLSGWFQNRSPVPYEVQEGRTGRLVVDVESIEGAEPAFAQTFTIFSGTVGGKPEGEFTSGLGTLRDMTYRWELNDRTGLLHDSIFADTFPYDGTKLNDAIAYLWYEVGVPPLILTQSFFDLLMDYDPAKAAVGDWILLPKRGDDRGQWLDQLIDRYAATFLRGWRPLTDGSYQWIFVDPNALGVNPASFVYCSSFDGFPWAEKISYGLLPPEVNQVLVVGYDGSAPAASLRYPTAQRDDAAAQNPLTPKAERPLNWRGRVIRYQLLDPDIRSQRQAEAAADILRDRLMSAQETIEIGCDPMFDEATGCPLWKGDVFRLVFSGAETWADYRITGLSFLMAKGDVTATYQAELLSQGGI